MVLMTRLLMGLVLVGGCYASAQAFPRLTLEREPNDTLETAQQIRGEFRLIGSVMAGDQDLYRWRLSDDDIDHQWRIELLAAGGADVSVDVEPFPLKAQVQAEMGIATFGSMASSAAQPEVTEQSDTPLLSLLATPQRSQVAIGGLLIPFADYLIRLDGRDGGGEYQLVLSREASLTLPPSLAADDEPQALLPGREWLYHLDRPEVSLPLALDADDVASFWQLLATTDLGSGVALTLENPEGSVYAAAVNPSANLGRLVLDQHSVLHMRQQDGEPLGRIQLHLENDGQRPPAHDDAPSHTSLPPRWLTLGEPASLWLDPGQPQRLALQVEASSPPLSLHVEGDDTERLTLCLHDDQRNEPTCRRATDAYLFEHAVLPAADYRITFEPPRRGEPTDITVLLKEGETLPDHHVNQPNNSADWAYPIAPMKTLEGRLGSDDEAWFAFDVGADMRQWQIKAQSDFRLSRLELYQPERLALDTLSFNALFPGEDRASAQSVNSETLLLDNLRLLPGRYLIRLAGSVAPYQLTLTPNESIAPGYEAEPNNLARYANPLWLGQEVSGTFHRVHDDDYFQLHIPGWNRVRLTIDPPEEVDTRAWLQWDGETRHQNEHLRLRANGEPQQASFWLSPGDRLLRLRGQQASDATYQARLELIPPWDLRDGVTPAPTPEHAPLIPRETRVSIGLQGKVVEEGYLRLPAGETQRELVLFGGVVTGERQPRGGETWITLRTEEGGEIPLTLDTRSREHSATLPAGQPIIMQVRFGPNTQPVDIVDAQRVSALPLHLEMQADHTTLAAFTPEGQQLAVELLIENPLDTPQTLALAAHLSHGAARLSGLPESLTVSAQSVQKLPLVLTAPPGLADGDSLVVFMRAGEHDERLALAVVRDATPRSPLDWQDDTFALHGLTDLAWAGLGAAFVDPESGEDVGERWRGRNTELRALIDGLSSASALDWREMGDPLPPLRLAGDGGSVQALLFNQRSYHDIAYRWRHVAVAAGNSPDQLSPLIEVELTAQAGEQVFALESPVEARYLQLTPLSVWGEPPGQGAITGIGMFRALGEPQGQLAQQTHDLLASEHGGHWLYTLPDLRSLHGLVGQRHTWGNQGRQVESRARQGERIHGRTIEMVFGFLNQRAARIDELRWIDDLDWQGDPVERVRIYTSTEGPVGPWERQASWALERDAEGVARFTLPDTPWVRYLKLVFDEPEADPEQHTPRWRIPASIQAIEASDLASGESILAYWGLDHTQGPYEALRTHDTAEPGAHFLALPADIATADLLGEGRFAEPGESAGYQVRLTEGNNTLAFFLAESLRGRLSVTLTDTAGEDLALTWRDEPGGRRAEAVGLAPGEYHITLAEPPRSIVFIWDGSGSIGVHQPAIYQALTRFAEGLRPGREVSNLIALGGPLLIDGWADSSAEMAMALGHYDMRFHDSDAEPALRTASQALAQQDGEKVIFLITDAEQVGRDLSAWETLAQVKPRIFSMSIGHGGHRDPDELRWYQNLMQAWSRVGDGRYSYATGRNDLIQAFEQGMRQLRNPTDYRLAVGQHYQEPPEPGSLQVLSGSSPVISAGAVQLIFDASGSMLQQMEGGRRIEVARRIVDDVLKNRIPEQVPVALRAFGHTEPHSCATELLVAAEPGSHARAREAVARLQAINLARTPLADSLLAVADDLAAYTDQPRLVVMLTDGEETCEGDVEHAIEALFAEGVNLQINIVGFHIDDAALQAEFSRLAMLGGGEYFDSRNDQQLAQGLTAALAARWLLMNMDGEIIANGRVDGEPIILPGGHYTLRLEVAGESVQHDIHIPPGESVAFQLE
ncbi:VWA domain-containing protein [Vreelandella zhaodongensis]|uniref:VWA domain-containing protein n=1 Tax=Vreelandella zhaodongensis TaxID=1176240 RepID=UPI003EBFA397